MSVASNSCHYTSSSYEWIMTDSRIILLEYSLLIPAIAISDVEDVRKVLEFYAQFDNPLEAFKERQKQLQVITKMNNITGVNKSFASI